MLTPLPHLEAIGNPYAVAAAPDGATANVIDRYKAMSHELIMGDLDANRSALVTLVVNCTNDFNKASVIRAHNAMNGRLVVIAGRRKYNRTGTMGSHNYTHVTHVPEPLDAVAALIADGYTVFPVDNTPEFSPQAFSEVTFPVKTALMFGEEGAGLSLEMVEACNGPAVFIQQYGSVRSLNVSQAAAIGMYAYELQHPRS